MTLRRSSTLGWCIMAQLRMGGHQCIGICAWPIPKWLITLEMRPLDMAVSEHVVRCTLHTGIVHLGTPINRIFRKAYSQAQFDCATCPKPSTKPHGVSTTRGRGEEGGNVVLPTYGALVRPWHMMHHPQPQGILSCLEADCLGPSRQDMGGRKITRPLITAKKPGRSAPRTRMWPLSPYAPCSDI